MEGNRRESSSEREEEKLNKAEALLTPRYENSSMLYEEIDKNIYGGEKDPAKRAERLKQFGYNAETLSQRGKEIKKQLQQLYDREADNGGDGTFSSLSEDMRNHALSLLGLVESKTGGGEKDYVCHSDASVGLAYELSRQMRKIAQVEAQPDPDNETVRHILRQQDVPSSREVAQRAISVGPEEFLKKKDAALKNISPGAKRKQYEIAFAIFESAL